MKTRFLLVTMGDPNGVGPEICVRLLSRRLELPTGMVPVILGDLKVLKQAQGVLQSKKTLVEIPSLEDAVSLWPRAIPVFSAGVHFSEKVMPGRVSKAAGAASIGWVRLAAELILAGEASAMVTAPICKESVEMTVPGFQGHTEFIGDLCGDPQPVLALVHGNWVVAHVSTHVSMREACDRVRQERILKVATLLHQFLRKYRGLQSPRIGVAGLNPHAGEHGLFGDEELQEILPAVKTLRKKHINATGPLPGDVVFPQLRAERFDGVVAMYHDQGHVVTKSLYFNLGKKPTVGGVNTTLGLPVLRTSVDHGTGFDIAWKGIASDLSLRDALLLAAKRV
ncbi:MAG TPA: 4-hydroxythreonine-4-phosphate dehydrogenase PdxA [Fibrobacteraceae bacterium]|nr:4-hydroxythreonine-4-phosphate dehydrogenase PdxA [Fibrobacteraceae bacterium]